jgi:hypothetical protein
VVGRSADNTKIKGSNLATMGENIFTNSKQSQQALTPLQCNFYEPRLLESMYEKIEHNSAKNLTAYVVQDSVKIQ